MQTTEVLISNVLTTGTAFAVLADDMTQSVFIPSKTASEHGLQPGDRVQAILVPNPTRPDKTPWLAVSIAAEASVPKDDLADKIIADLEEGRATAEEVSESIGASLKAVAAKMIEMAGMGQIISYTVFDLPED